MENQPRNERRVAEGVVLSSKMQKTVVVGVTERVPHPKYKKLVERKKKYYAHNDHESVKKGDKVEIMETRPLSKLKRWRVTQVVKV